MQKKVRTPIVWFGVFMALMLFQTSYMRLGTLTAFGALACTIFTAFSSGNTSIEDFRFPLGSKILIVFLVLTTLVTIIYGNLPGYYGRFVAQIILCIVLATIRLNEREAEFLQWAFVISAAFYSLMTIRSCIQLEGIRYLHDNIVLFNAQLDPNFIGIPFVSASVLLLDNILDNQKRIISFVLYIVILIAIIYTASRGNLICLVLSNVILLIFYLVRRDVSITVKAIWIVIIVLVACYLIYYLSVNYEQQWERMTELGEGSDNGRFELWTRAFDAWEQSPIWGNGLGAMYRIYGKASHNSYFQLLSETGISGLLLFLWFSVKLLMKAVRYHKAYFCMLIGMLAQIAFLDAADNRCVWIVFCWMSML